MLFNCNLYCPLLYLKFTVLWKLVDISIVAVIQSSDFKDNHVQCDEAITCQIFSITFQYVQQQDYK
jgi:hypothetical protein